MIKSLSLLMTIAVFVFVYRYAGHPGFKVRHLAMTASAYLMMGVPMLVLLFLLAVQGKWPGFIFICGLIAAFAAGSIIGYMVAAKRNKDPFHGAMIWGMWMLPLAGTPLAVHLLP